MRNVPAVPWLRRVNALFTLGITPDCRGDAAGLGVNPTGASRWRCDALQSPARLGKWRADSRLMEKRQVLERSGLTGSGMSCRRKMSPCSVRERVERGGWFFGWGSCAPLSPGRRDWAPVRGACGDLESRPQRGLLIGRVGGWPRFCFPRRRTQLLRSTDKSATATEQPLSPVHAARPQSPLLSQPRPVKLAPRCCCFVEPVNTSIGRSRCLIRSAPLPVPSTEIDPNYCSADGAEFEPHTKTVPRLPPLCSSAAGLGEGYGEKFHSLEWLFP